MIQGQNYEYHLTIVSVKLIVKFPCKMKIEHQGSFLAGETPVSEDHRFVFNQTVTIKDTSNKQCLELTFNLLTDKGAKYIAGVAKLYPSEMARSEGQRLVVSLAKCIDPEAFCELKVDQVFTRKSHKANTYERKSAVHREIPYRPMQNMDYSPHRSAYNHRVQQSKSQYQAPLHHQHTPIVRQDWDTKSKSRLKPPQTVYQKSRVAHRINYGNNHEHLTVQGGQLGVYEREKLLEAEVYKQGYQKLKEKYKKQAQQSKQELNKRLALENNQNNLKLQIMKLKLKAQEQQKIVSDKNSKLKEAHLQLSNLQQKESEVTFLRDENSKKDSTIRLLEDKVRTATRSLEELKDIAEERSSNDSGKIKDLQIELNNLKLKFDSRQRQLQKDNKSKYDTLHEKQLQLVSKTDSLERQRKSVSDLERALQNKHYEMEKVIQAQRNSSKQKQDESKAKIDKLEHQIQKIEDEKKQQYRELQQLKNSQIKNDYDKKILHQELETLKIEFTQMKSFKEKYNEVLRENRSMVEERTHIERQLQKTIQNKDSSISDISRQFQDQLQYYKRINRDQDEKIKSMSNKMMEIEGQLDLSRGQQDKIRRNYESSIKEAADAKQKEKSAKKALKVKEQEILSMETEHATMKQKLKSIDQITKLEVDKQRQQNQKIRIQFQNQLDKNEELQESNSQMSMELSKLKIKLQYADDKADKDASNLRDKQNQVEGLIKDYEEQIAGLDQTINTLRLSEKQLSTKFQKSELELINSEEKYERTRKDLKVVEEKCNSLDSALKIRNNEVQSLSQERQNLESRNTELETELSDLKNEYSVAQNQKMRQIRKSEMLMEAIEKAKTDNSSLGTAVSGKDKEIQELNNKVKEQKDEFVKLDIQFNNFKKQISRNKDTLFDVIQKSLFTLPLGTKEDGKKSIDLLLNKKPVQNTFGQHFAMIINHSKEVKQALVRQTDLINQLQRQKERLQDEVSSKSNKYQNTEMTLKKQIEELELQLQSVIEQKQNELNNNAQAIEMFEEKIKEFEIVVEELNNQIEEMNFTNNSLKMDYQVVNQQNTKKNTNLKKLNAELEEKIQYQTLVIAELDQRCNILEGNTQNLQQTIDNQGQAHTKKDKLIQELKDTNKYNQKLLEELKKNKKQLSQKVSELQLYLNTEKQINQKLRTSISEEESKTNQLKNFITNLMKQKQNAIKSDLQRSQTIMSLETTLHELRKDIELVTEQNNKNAKNLQTQKDLNKKLQANIKELESDKKDEKSRYLKTNDLLREKQKDIVNKQQNIKRLELKYQKMVEKYKLEVKQLQSQLETKTNFNLEQTKQHSDKVFNLQSQLQKKSSALTILEDKLSQIEENLFSQKQKNVQHEQAIKSLKAQNEEYKMKIHEMDATVTQMTDETKLKEEQLFQFSGKNYSLEHKIQSKHREHLQEMEMLNYQWTEKYDSMCEEYQQRLELIEKERNYFKSLNDEKDRQITKLNHNIREGENHQANTRKLYEQKLKKSEQSKLALAAQKNTQSHRLTQELKTLSDSMKTKQSQLRKVSNELEVARKTITNLDIKSREYDQKLKGVNKLYQNELEQLKKRDLSFKTYKESITNYLWNMERDIKKGLQHFIKNFLQLNEDRNSQRIVDLARGLQKSIVDVMSVKPSQK